MLKLIEYIFLGLLQGITEPIPVSSSGHLLILKTILEKMNRDLNIDFETLATITNLGSLVAIIIIFRKEIISLISAFLKFIFKKDREKTTVTEFNYCLKIIIATIPAGVVGLIATKMGLLEFLEENVKFIGLMLLVTSLFLFLIRNFEGVKDSKEITYKDAIIIGIYQMISIIPGISRSGATIVGGMFQKLKRKTAFNFSFILYLPISIATSILGVKDLLEMTISKADSILYIISAVIAGVFTYIFTKWFQKIVKEGKLIYFSIYCLILGLIVIIVL